MIRIWILLLCLFSSPQVALAKPYMILTSTRTKCVSVMAAGDQRLTIEYDSPDMELIEEDKQGELAGAAASARKVGADGQGLDTEWNKRMQEKLEQMKSRKMRDMSITITQKVGLSGALASRQRTTYGGGHGNDITGQGRIREELVRRQGKIHFLTGTEDGTVDICVQSILANKLRPTRVSLIVTVAAADKADDGGSSADKKKKDKNPDSLESVEVKEHMSRMERDLQTLTNRVRAILNNADFNKDQEVAFHEQSIAMNRATTYWPIIQLIVLIVTGFTQANHIVQFMKSHHIGA